MTNKETTIFSMKELQENINESINSPQQFQPTTLNDDQLPTRPAPAPPAFSRPKSHMFQPINNSPSNQTANVNSSEHQMSTTIKITSMKLNEGETLTSNNDSSNITQVDSNIELNDNTVTKCNHLTDDFDSQNSPLQTSNQK